jgi:hydroxymethylbilane synthase
MSSAYRESGAASMARRVLRIGTRGSPLALAQTAETRHRLAAHGADPALLETVVIKTTGDMVLDRPLAEIGGKGLFTKEIDAAMLAGGIDLAVHSVKDLPTVLPEGIVLAAVLPRADPRDALIGPDAGGDGGRLAALPAGAVIGTASLRRGAQLLARRPDVTVVPLRGNVQTRLERVREGRVHATLLAMAGLGRLGMAHVVTAALPVEEMLPAVGQGAIGVTCRADDEDCRALLAGIDDAQSHVCVAAERAMLAVLDGSCRTPIAGLAEIDAAGRLRLRGLVARPDGSAVLTGERQGDITGGIADARRLGADLGLELRRRAGPGFFQGPS